MRRIIFIFIFIVAIVCGFSFCTEISAALLDDEDILLTSSDLDEVKVIENQIIDKAKGHCSLNGYGSIGNDIIVDYDQAVRVYVNDLFFENIDVSEQRVEEIINSCLEKAYYAWQIPVHSVSTGKSVGVVVSRRLPLSEDRAQNFTEEEKKRISENAGKFSVTDASIFTERDSIFSYVDKIENSLPSGVHVRIFGSQPGFFQPVGVVIADGKISSIFSLGYEYEACTDNGETIVREKLYDYASLYPDIAAIYERNLFGAELGLQGGSISGEEYDLSESSSERSSGYIICLSGIVVMAALVSLWRYFGGRHS